MLRPIETGYLLTVSPSSDGRLRVGTSALARNPHLFGIRFRSELGPKATLDALGRSLAIIEFSPSGTILSANENFCEALGYSLSEIKGKHHSMFVGPDDVRSAEYKAFWEKLGRGEFHAREYKRIAKGGREVWIQASYNPVKNAKGAVEKVVKVATVVTADKLRNAEFESKINAISLVQAVIELTPSGEVLTANDNFLNLLGYRLDEIKGQHHRLFVDPAYANSPEYQAFWDKLNSGNFVNESFKRIGKGGKEIWIQASYNPIFDLNKNVVKIVKFATDITDLTHIGEGLTRLAAGNLDHSIKEPFTPAFAKLRTDFNSAHDNLQSALVRIAEGSNTIQAGTQEISSASDDLSRRTEQQAASLEETAAALDEITATVKKTSEGTVHAQTVVASTKSDAEHAGQIVGQAVEAMSTIEKSSKEIGQIIGVIDEIAFQTNLLALNAGVEAARAGDAGRGFAVVASEVRALAQRSAQAAKEIKALISASGQQVKSGVDLVNESGKALGRIVVKVGDINTIVGEIAHSTKEQATALHEVNSAINQMDQVTQQNAAMVEQSTAATHSLSQETTQLSDLVGQFQLGHTLSAPVMHHGADKVPLLQPNIARDTAFSKGKGRENPPSPSPRALRLVGNTVRKPAAEEGWTEF
jgi:methyl-accepting chemotaxis protein